MIEINGLKKSFGEVEAVRGIDFRAKDGQITGLLGPNGAGKTTTLRMLYTLLKPDEGTILIDGMDPHQEPIEVKRKLGVVPDSRGLYTRLSARENIGYFGQLHGLKPKQIEERIEELTDILDMRDFIDRRTEGFSKGSE